MPDKKWKDSKKTGHMIFTQTLVAAMMIAVMWWTGGDPEKAKQMMEALSTGFLAIGGTGGFALLTQGAQDVAKSWAGTSEKLKPRKKGSSGK